jgi:hypothetical protein
MSGATERRAARRAELVRRLTDLAPKSRLDAMLEEVDGRALVRSLAAEEVYATIIDVGLSDSTEVVQLATPEQFRTFIDLAAWVKDRMDPIEVLHWLRAARGDDEVDFIQKIQGLDIEVLELLFKRLVVVHDLEENPDVNPEGLTVETPDNKYLLEFTLDGVDESALRRLVQDLMANNPFELSRFIEAVRWEQSTELEETAFQFRQARLEDLGFPPLDESVKVFAWLDPDKVPVVTAKSGALAPAGRVDYVGAAFAGLGPVERQNLEGEVRYLVNCVLVAEGAEPGDPPALRRTSEQTRDWLDLGLEHLTSGVPENAPEVVRERPLRFIFQVGFSLTLKLKRQAERMASEAKFAETWLVLDEETAMLQALLRRRPLKALKVPGAEAVPFRSKKELAETEAQLARVKGQRAVFGFLLGSSPTEVVARFGQPLSELTPQRLMTAVVAWAETEGQLMVAPFSEMKLSELCMRLLADGPVPRASASAGQRAKAVLTEAGVLSSELSSMIDRVVSSLVEMLGPAWGKDSRVDPAKVFGLPLAGR